MIFLKKWIGKFERNIIGGCGTCGEKSEIIAEYDTYEIE